jgi:acyltransferase
MGSDVNTIHDQYKSSQIRIGHIDLLRSIGIIVMIMGHTGFGSVFYKWIHCFHMPMFFIISGYLYKGAPFSKLISRRTKSLLVPYFAFGIIHCVIYFLAYGFDTKVLYSLFWENTNGNMPIAGALWFLTAMFFSEIIFCFIQQLNLSTIWTTAISFVVAVAGMICANYLPFRLPFALDVGMVGVGLYQIGKLIKDKWNKIININLFITLTCIVLFSISGLANGYINLKKGWYGIWPLFWINAVGITVSLWNLARIVYNWGQENNFLTKCLCWLQGIGKDSIIYLCLNQLMILINRSIFDLFIPASNNMILLGRNIIIFPLTMLELYFVQKLIMNTRIRVIVGKF